MSLRTPLLWVFGLFSAIMLGLAAGAIWMVATLYLRQLMPWLALPVGAVLAWAVRGSVLRPGVGAAALAALATLLAAFYMSMLLAGVRLAGDMGLGLLDVLRTAGPGMLWALAELALTPWMLAWFAAGAALAAVIGMRPPRRRAPSATR